MRDLPLNGRNYLDLAKMALGVAEPSGAGTPGTAGDRAKNGGGFVANGVRSDMNNFILDGVDNNAKIPDLSSNSNVIIQPSVDAIQEFKVETNNFSAEYGYSAGAVVNATIKAGTNAFHGTAFEFLRNDQLDARDYFLQPTAKKAILQRNLYGGTVGGPIVKNKTFVFGSWEGTRLNQGTTLVTTIPTDAMKIGNFSGAGLKPIFDPASLAPNGTRIYPNAIPWQYHPGEPDRSTLGEAVGADSRAEQSGGEQLRRGPGAARQPQPVRPAGRSELFRQGQAVSALQLLQLELCGAGSVRAAAGRQHGVPDFHQRPEWP